MNPTKIREINAHLKALMDELYEYIHDSCAQIKPLDGVRILQEHPQAAMVSMSTIKQSDNLNLHPSYYLPGVQERIVSKYLIADRPSIDVLQKRLEKICQEKKVVTNKDSVFLNANMLSLLSELLLNLQQ